MTCHCPTCCCEHKGKFPEFAFYFADGSVYRGGGPDDQDLVVYAWPRSWVEMPAYGVVVGASENRSTGRDWHRGGEQYYAVPFGARGGPGVTQTGYETGLAPLVNGKLGIVKSGEFMRTEDFHKAMRLAMDDGFVPAQKPRSPFAFERPLASFELE